MSQKAPYTRSYSNGSTALTIRSMAEAGKGGELGTCFDVSVLKEGDTYRMWFSWRPKKSIDGQQWLLWYNGRKGGVERIGLALHQGEGLGF